MPAEVDDTFTVASPAPAVTAVCDVRVPRVVAKEIVWPLLATPFWVQRSVSAWLAPSTTSVLAAGAKNVKLSVELVTTSWVSAIPSAVAVKVSGLGLVLFTV